MDLNAYHLNHEYATGYEGSLYIHYLFRNFVHILFSDVNFSELKSIDLMPFLQFMI